LIHCSSIKPVPSHNTADGKGDGMSDWGRRSTPQFVTDADSLI
jgi:hypothetical protein